MLLSAAGVGTVEIMRRTGKSKTCVWRWQERFAEEGVDGLLPDKARPSGIPNVRGAMLIEGLNWKQAVLHDEVATPTLA